MGGGGGGDNGMMMMMTIIMMQQMQQMQQQQMQQIDAQQTAQARKQAQQVQADVQANTWDMLRQYGQNNAQTASAAGNMGGGMGAVSNGMMPTSLTNQTNTPLLTQLAANPMTSTSVPAPQATPTAKG